MKYALITGASGGIGRELANYFAADGIPLILVARRKDKLLQAKTEISQKYDVEVQVFGLDLSQEGAPEKLYDLTEKHALEVGFLVNNAGFGDSGDLIKADTGKIKNMIRLNNEALVVLSKLYGADMARHGEGKIANIASAAGFVPGPGMAVYYASKAFVISFSQALAEELRAEGVTVTTVCPGAAETGFAEAAGAGRNRLFNRKLPSSREVAEFVYKSIKSGKLVAVWGISNRIYSRLVSLAPRKRVLASVRKLNNV